MVRVGKDNALTMLAVDPTPAVSEELGGYGSAITFYLAEAVWYVVHKGGNVTKKEAIHFRIVETQHDAMGATSNTLKILNANEKVLGPHHHDLTDSIFPSHGDAPEFKCHVAGDTCTVSMNDQVTKIDHTSTPKAKPQIF